MLDEDFQTYNEAMKDYLAKRLIFQRQYEDSNPKGESIRLKPKNIWLLHGGRLAKEMGSLSLVDTQFGEQKNAQLKQFGQRASQTKNVLLTLGKREKRFMAVNKMEKNYGKTYGPVSIQHCAIEIREAVESCIRDPNNFSFFSKYQMFDSVIFGSFETAVAYRHPRNPFYGMVATVAVHNKTQEVFFVLQETKTCKVTHLDLLKIEPSNKFLLLKPSQIVLGKALNIYKRPNQTSQIVSYIANFF